MNKSACGRYVFDIETNGLLPEVNIIHCLHIVDVVERRYQRFDNRTGDDYTEINIGLGILEKADELIGHNIIKYDIPVIQHIVPSFKPTGLICDTLVYGRLIHSNIIELDFSRWRKRNLGRMCGWHSLESWGLRLGMWKGDYKYMEDVHGGDPWRVWRQEMSDYCEQDIAVNLTLWDYLEAERKKQKVSEEAMRQEQDVAQILWEQECHGFMLDIPKTEALYEKILLQKNIVEAELSRVMVDVVKPKDKAGEPFIPKRPNSKIKWLRIIGVKRNDETALRFDRQRGYRVEETVGYEKDVPVYRATTVPFNAGSRDHIIYNLKSRYDWVPKEFTPKSVKKSKQTGLKADLRPLLNEDVMNALPYPEAPLLAEYFMLIKRLGQIGDGDKAWLKHVNPETSRVHGTVNTNGAVTGRMTHSNPNVAQVPSLANAKGEVPYGGECRECWTVPEGRVLVGCDASGLELRMLAHYMAMWDGGEYADLVLNGDIHTHNMNAAKLDTRSKAKRMIYALLYGAGAGLLGEIATGTSNVKAGKQLKETFFSGLPALGNLMEGVTSTVEQKQWLRGLDRRILPSRSPHSALNLLLQSAGAVVLKRALVLGDRAMKAAELDYAFCANVHDEWQIECAPRDADAVGQAMVDATVEAGKQYGLRIALDGEYKVGKTWKDTH